MKEQLLQEIRVAVQELFSVHIEDKDIILQPTNKEYTGDITLVTFSLAKISKKKPDETGQLIGEYLEKNSKLVSSFEVVKGFLNLTIKDSYWKNFLLETLPKENFGFLPQTELSPQVMVEYSSPNTNKPLHLGHIRNNLLGYSIAEILKATGHRVVKANLVNDRGIHICKSMLAWVKWGNGETPQSSGMKGDHLIGKYYVLFDKKLKAEIHPIPSTAETSEEAEKNSALMKEVQQMLRNWEAGDKDTIALWKMMNGWVYEGFDVTYKNLGVDFDKIYYESETYLLGKKIVEEGLSKKIFYKKDDGSVWVDLRDVGLDEKVLLRSDGTSVYITQDLGTAQLRFDDYRDLVQLIYVVGNEQDYHFKVLKEIFKKLQRPWAEGLLHFSYGMVDLPSGKMKSREGTVVDADDLIEEMNSTAKATTEQLGKIEGLNKDEAEKLYHTLGMGALKYFILKVDPKKRMLFNPAESIDFNGNTGPFIQYTHARIHSVLEKGKKILSEYKTGIEISELNAEEKEIIKIVHRFPETLQEAAKLFSPAAIANYVYELAKAYNHFYHLHTVVDAENISLSFFRLKLSGLAGQIIRQAMELLGIEVPIRM
jgi:arginyl-tRNA synthetase